MNLYTIRDKVAQTYGFPFGAENTEQATRSFEQFLHNMKSQSPTLPLDDYELIETGVWNQKEIETWKLEKGKTIITGDSCYQKVLARLNGGQK